MLVPRCPAIIQIMGVLGLLGLFQLLFKDKLEFLDEDSANLLVFRVDEALRAEHPPIEMSRKLGT